MPIDLFAKRDFSAAERRHDAGTGAAMPGGRFPIESAHDVTNAVRLIGHAPDRAAVTAHIRSRAKALGLGDPFAKRDVSAGFTKDWSEWDAEHRGLGEHLGHLASLGASIYHSPRIARAINRALKARGFKLTSRMALSGAGAYGAVRVADEAGSYLGRKIDRLFG